GHARVGAGGIRGDCRERHSGAKHDDGRSTDDGLLEPARPAHLTSLRSTTHRRVRVHRSILRCRGRIVGAARRGRTRGGHTYRTVTHAPTLVHAPFLV